MKHLLGIELDPACGNWNTIGPFTLTPARHDVECAACLSIPEGRIAQEIERAAILEERQAWYTDADQDEGPTCSICDGLGHGYPGGGPYPIESPDPDYYAAELAAGR